jgi:hypothetical protein
VNQTSFLAGAIGIIPLLLVTGSLHAQDPPASVEEEAKPAAEPADKPSDVDSATSSNQTQKSGAPSNRLFFALPNFLTVENQGNVPPLTTWEKFKLTARGSFDPVELALYGVLAGIAQAENNEPSFGQGAKGYAQRYGIRFADGTIENFMAHSVFTSVLHQDPRYFQLGKGGVWHRTRYALTRILITRSDSGKTEINFSEIFGSGTAAAISTYTYHPRDERDVGNVMGVWGSQVGWDAVGYLAKEFWPDIQRKLHHGHGPKSASASSH